MIMQQTSCYIRARLYVIILALTLGPAALGLNANI